MKIVIGVMKNEERKGKKTKKKTNRATPKREAIVIGTQLLAEPSSG